MADDWIAVPRRRRQERGGDMSRLPLRITGNLGRTVNLPENFDTSLAPSRHHPNESPPIRLQLCTRPQ
jgi:hypothetical protein